MAKSEQHKLRLTRLKLTNWRNFQSAEVSLAKRAFFIGPNASGKSNLLDAIRFLRDLVKPIAGGFTLADAFHFGSMQAVDLGAALPALLLAHPPAKAEQESEAGLEPMVAVDLAGNVADDAAQIGPERAQRPVGALELLGMGVTLMLDQGELADPRVGLP